MALKQLGKNDYKNSKVGKVRKGKQTYTKSLFKPLPAAVLAARPAT
jgi:hypothetical protein